MSQTKIQNENKILLPKSQFFQSVCTRRSCTREIAILSVLNNCTSSTGVVKSVELVKSVISFQIENFSKSQLFQCVLFARPRRFELLRVSSEIASLLRVSSEIVIFINPLNRIIKRCHSPFKGTNFSSTTQVVKVGKRPKNQTTLFAL
jgi:hypothetical protein